MKVEGLRSGREPGRRDSGELGPPVGARCERHPDVGAVYLCARCGSYLCTECTVIGEDAESYCPECEVALPSPIPWEDRHHIGWFSAAWRTAWATLSRPVDFFRLRPREASVWPAVVYGYLFTLLADLSELARLVVRWEAESEVPSTAVEMAVLVGRPLGSPLWHGLWLTGMGLAWWIGLRVVGGRPPYREVLRALSYANVVALLGVGTTWLEGPLAVVAIVLTLLWALLFQTLATSRLLDDDLGRAVAAMLVVTLLVVALGCLLWVLPLRLTGF